jgi:iron complex transport system substrate-binding protein
VKNALFPVDIGRDGAFLRYEKVKKGKTEKVWLLGSLAILCLAACQRPATNVATMPRPKRQVTDDLGRSVTVPVEITRVVSTAPSVTENVFAVGAGDRLVGVTTFCNYPEEAKKIAKIGDTQNPNMETIIALKPDIVLVSTASQIENFAKVLADNGVAVYVTDPVTLDKVFDSLERLGQLFDTQETANRLADGLRKRVDDVYQKSIGPSTWDNLEGYQPTRVFVQVSREPLFTIGKLSFLTSLLEKVDAESVTGDIRAGYVKLSKETAAALRPFAIIISDSPDNQEPNDAFRDSPAVVNGRVYKVNADLLSRPGPRLVDAMEQIAKMLHPKNFRNNQKTEN